MYIPGYFIIPSKYYLMASAGFCVLLRISFSRITHLQKAQIQVGAPN